MKFDSTGKTVWSVFGTKICVFTLRVLGMVAIERIIRLGSNITYTMFPKCNGDLDLLGTSLFD